MNSIKHRAIADASHNNVGDPDPNRESHFIASERFCPKDRTDAGGEVEHSSTTYRMPSLFTGNLVLRFTTFQHYTKKPFEGGFSYVEILKTSGASKNKL